MKKFLEKLGVRGLFIFTLLVTIAPFITTAYLLDNLPSWVVILSRVGFWIGLIVLVLGWVVAIVGTSHYPKKKESQPIRNWIRDFAYKFGWSNTKNPY